MEATHLQRGEFISNDDVRKATTNYAVFRFRRRHERETSKRVGGEEGFLSLSLVDLKMNPAITPATRYRTISENTVSTVLQVSVIPSEPRLYLRVDAINLMASKN
ncbi:unnamed protein product [Cyprideis torosa]|uniref:Uncharacterized protein n=1 Tax=Cyprideis torosa TaxID=163714 RepID=A0A7R8W5A0_9CRUS|nr:unnamed protein product [Cyprideis torosa]CAG0879632.1 unnamed protein product [Cyprideis torosa]